MKGGKPSMIDTNLVNNEESTAMLLSRITFIISMLLLIILYIVTPKKIAGQKDTFFNVSEITITVCI